MKKALLSCVVGAMAVPAAFGEYTAMTFKSADGTTHSIGSTGLKIEFVDGSLVATNGTETLTLPLTSLATMEFTGENSGINDISSDLEGELTLYTTAGIGCGTFKSLDAAKSSLPQGIYIAKSTSGKITKIILQ